MPGGLAYWRVPAMVMLALLSMPYDAAHAESSAVLISTFRQAHGEGSVTLDPVLTTIARAQADAMAAKGVMDHDVLGVFSSRIAPAKAGRAAENIAYGYDDFPRTLGQWINSPSHRKNLLLKDATKVGVASAKSPVDKRTYWAMVIAGGYEKPPALEPKIANSKPANSRKPAKLKPAKSRPAESCRVSVLGLCL